LRIAIYSGTIPATTFIERLITGLAESGAEVVLHGRMTEGVRYRSRNIKVIGYTGLLSRTILAIKFLSLFLTRRPQTLRNLLTCYPETKFSKSFLYWFVRTAPIVWQEPDIFHLQWTKGVEEWIFLQQFGIKVVVSLRGSQLNYSPVVDKKLEETYCAAFPYLDGFHCVSEAIAKKALKYGAYGNAVRVVYSGINLEEFPFVSSKSIRRESVKIISVGRPHWVKGYHYAIDAMKFMKDDDASFHYRVVGGTSEELKFQVQDLGLNEYVAIEEGVSFENVKALITDADILLLPSVEEGIPNVVLEAMALGTIVVSTECGGVREVINDGKNGFIVPIRDPRAIANSIQAILDTPDEELHKVRQSAREKIELQHSLTKMVSDMNRLYRLAVLK
jgi:glycosyltransferase involved in cell wall biosynthesis